METLPVLFRIERRKGGEVTAVFPTVPADYAGNEITVYAHIGQHGGASWAWLWQGRHRAAKPEEYADLLTELRSIYGRSTGPDDPAYELKVYRRVTPQMRAAYREELRRVNRPVPQESANA